MKALRGESVEGLLGSKMPPLCCVWKLLWLFMAREIPIAWLIEDLDC
jgi:hypothetical protein